MHGNPYALTLVQGKRFTKTWRWPQSLKTYKAISGIPQKTPLRVTANGHAAPDGWPVKFTGVRGPTQINDRWVKSRLIDANTIEVNALNAGDLPDYSGGGYVEYFQPVDLAAFNAGRAVLKESVTDTTPVLEISMANGRMLLDNTLKTVTFDVDEATVAAITKLAGIWDWEMTASGIITSPLGAMALPPWELIQEAAT